MTLAADRFGIVTPDDNFSFYGTVKMSYEDDLILQKDGMVPSTVGSSKSISDTRSSERYTTVSAACTYYVNNMVVQTINLP